MQGVYRARFVGHIICVRQGNKYSEDYTYALSKSVKRHLGEDLIVLGDGPDADIELDKGYKGYWSKLELFKPELQPLRPFLFFDLDTYILQDCRELLKNVTELHLIRDFYRPNHGESGVMLIPKMTDNIWENHFKCDHGIDGKFLETQPHRILNDWFPSIVSYKKHKRDNGDVRPDAKICAFHGRPPPHETTGWAKEEWRSLLT